MKYFLCVCMLFQAYFSFAQDNIMELPLLATRVKQAVEPDWLLGKFGRKAEVYRSKDNKNIILDNGLLRRSFLIDRNLACFDYLNLLTQQQLIRGLSPEAKITLNGKVYNIGGLHGQQEKGYFKYQWADSLTSNQSDFQYQDFRINNLKPHIEWKRTPGWLANSENMAIGKIITFRFISTNPELKNIIVELNYEIYDGLPLICKWLSVKNNSHKELKIDKVVNEVLAVHEEESSVAGTVNQLKPPHGLYIESNYAFNNSMTARYSDQTTHWLADSTYRSQVNYNFQTPCLMEVYPPIGPGITLSGQMTFNSIRTYELLLDSYDRERNGIAQQLMYRKIAPWVNENPIFLHVTSIDPKVVYKAIDQCAETGYEALILSFGSDLNMEDTSSQNINHIKMLVDYGRQKGIKVGGYSLFSSRRINDSEDVIDPITGKADVHAAFIYAPCLGSNWGLSYLQKLKYFIKATGLSLFENDGPYAGDVCASTKHPGHKGLEDSQWAQMELQKELYHWCRENNIYVNAPDWYFLDGSNKVALGYREVNFSLPREQQIILNRQNIFDGTWEKTPSMSWGFVPLTEYHGGGAAATLEPLSEHLGDYEQLMTQYYGAGIQACYRGPRLYDVDTTKALVIKTISWYKKYRRILNSQIVHLRRADGRDWDGILHVDPLGKEKGFVLLYNPLGVPISRSLKLPLYYTGLERHVSIREKEGKPARMSLNRKYELDYKVNLPANGYTWFVIEQE